MSSRYIESAYLQTTTGNDGLTPSGLMLDGTGTGTGTSAGPVGATATFAPIFVQHLDAWSIMFAPQAGSTLVGTLTVQASNDRGMQEQTGRSGVDLVDWLTISIWDQGAGAQAANKSVVTGPGVYIIGDRYCLYRWVRLVYTSTSGTGNVRALIQQKGWP